MKNNRGFTLMEILIALTILSILATLGVAGYRHHRRSAAEAVLSANLQIMRHAIEQYRADRGKYPPGLDDLWRESSRRYLREIPIDPITRSRNMWVVDVEPPDPDNPDGEVGISNVRSGADGVDLQGMPYSDY
ncbi:MAG: prepilin-type N-terminal cleavage/methylation domain-containing protein [Holophagales bacterium]|jgi:general secretion pathway protein G|nr:prepilin-type N-terminal cleavage/methylation domain-containing protein [Holophagales bacterium]